MTVNVTSKPGSEDDGFFVIAQLEPHVVADARVSEESWKRCQELAVRGFSSMIATRVVASDERGFD